MTVCGLSPPAITPISNNLVQNISANTGRFVRIRNLELTDNFYATVTGNHVLTSQNAIQVENFFLPDPIASPTVDLVSGNTIDYYHRGIFLNLQYAISPRPSRSAETPSRRIPRQRSNGPPTRAFPSNRSRERSQKRPLLTSISGSALWL